MSAERLAGAGWSRTASGKWWHPSWPGIAGRKKLFTMEAALSLLDADPTQSIPLAVLAQGIDEDPED